MELTRDCWELTANRLHAKAPNITSNGTKISRSAKIQTTREDLAAKQRVDHEAAVSPLDRFMAAATKELADLHAEAARAFDWA